MKLQNLIVIFIIIVFPIILITSLYISIGLKTIEYQILYDKGIITATHDAIYAFEINTAKNSYSGNPEIKRDILKASVKMFEKSLTNTCGISAYNLDEIEEYIPAIVFGMYDGFYMYTPSCNPNNNNRYEHSLKSYVYYSETLKGIGDSLADDITITYSLDNYVTVSGDFGDDEDNNGSKDGYKTKSGYLITGWNSSTRKYKGIEIKKEIIDGNENDDAIKYYEEAYNFTQWFNEYIGKKIDYLEIDEDNDPENEDSDFVRHKRTVIKNKVEGVLNSTITAYSKRILDKVYKMPKLTEEDWKKIYSNISMITFFQGKNIGLTKYNGYCVLNSTNSNEYVNPNLIYFIDNNNEYHDIRCTSKSGNNLIGYKIGDFRKFIVEETDSEGNTTSSYKYKHKELACYNCVSGMLDAEKTVYEYIEETTDNDEKRAYWTSLARERYNQVHL